MSVTHVPGLVCHLCARSVPPLQLTRPGFGPGLKPLGRTLASRRHAGCGSRVAVQRYTRQPARRDGFGTRALAAQLSDRSVRPARAPTLRVLESSARNPRTLVRDAFPLAALKWRTVRGKLRSPPSAPHESPLHIRSTNRGRRFVKRRHRPRGVCRAPFATRHPPSARSATVLVHVTPLAAVTLCQLVYPSEQASRRASHHGLGALPPAPSPLPPGSANLTCR